MFAGTPQFAVPALKAVAGQFGVCGVLTAPDRPAGRGRRVVSSPVRREAEHLGVPVVAPAKFDEQAMQMVAAFRADILVVAAYGVIFAQRFLDLFAGGVLNVHPSLLPRYRGAAPVPAAVLSGDHQSGVTIQRVVLRMDSGPILGRRVHDLAGSETTGSLTAELSESGAQLLKEVLARLERGPVEEIAQAEAEATYCSKVAPADGRIDWYADDACAIERMVRAYDPWPRAHCRLGQRRLNLIAARMLEEEEAGTPGQIDRVDAAHGVLVRTARGTLGVTVLQLEGRRALDWKAFANGYAGLAGARLT